jgi:nitric oxide dioxygenase
VQESPDTVSFALGSPDGSNLPAFRPGQYVSVAVRLPDGARQIRQYSLTGGRGADEWAITVKAVPAGRGEGDAIVPAGEVSNFLHHNVFEGDGLDVSAPFGDMVLDQGDAPLVLLSAGIGVTPILGMLRHLCDEGSTREVLVVHADRSPARHAHRQELKELVAELPSATLHRWYEDLGTRPARDVLSLGRVDVAGLDLPADAQVYLCGPLAFMESVRDVLLARGLPASHLHYEVFGPDTWLASA